LIAKENHLFAVEISENGCKDTSDCVQVTTAGVNQPMQSLFWISPNPNRGQFAIHALESLSGTVEIFNAAGQSVYRVQAEELKGLAVDMAQPAGLYLLQISTDKGIVQQRIGISK
jgi:hypothetical protein